MLVGGFAASFIANGWMGVQNPPFTQTQQMIFGCSAAILGAFFAGACNAVIAYCWKHYDREEEDDGVEGDVPRSDPER